MAKEGSDEVKSARTSSDTSSDTISVTLSDVSVDTDERTVVADEEESDPLLSKGKVLPGIDVIHQCYFGKVPMKHDNDDDNDGDDGHSRGIRLDHPIVNTFRRRCREWKRARAMRKRNRSTRVRRGLIFLKIAFLLGLLSWFVVSLCLRSKARGHSFQNDLHGCPHTLNSSREIVVDRSSQSIWGRWPLYDLLSLRTTSGSIAINIELQPADPVDPEKPAKLVLQTTSGSIAVSFSAPRAAYYPLGAALEEGKNGQTNHEEREIGHTHPGHHAAPPPPPRPYELEIQTTSGSVSGRFVFSSSASVVSQSGSIQGLFIPVVYEGLESNASLVTQTTSGSQYLEMSEPVVIPSSSSSGTSLSNFASSSHESTSGTLHIQYPPSWAGTIEASGSRICLNGEGLEVVKDGQEHATGVRHPREDDDHEAWWGSSGNMTVELKGETIDFYLRQKRGERL